MTNLYANCSVCNLTKVIEASSAFSASFPSTGVISGAIAVGDDSSKGSVYGAGVVLFFDGFEAAARVDGDGFGVVPVTGALFAAGVVFLGFGVGPTSAPPAATFASNGDGEGAREW